MRYPEHDENQSEEKELEILRRESHRLIEANDQWFEEYAKEFRAATDKRVGKKVGHS